MTNLKTERFCSVAAIPLLIALLLLLNLQSFADYVQFSYLKIAPGALVPKLNFYEKIDLEPGSGGIRQIQFSPNNKFIAIAYTQPKLGGSVKVFNIKPRKELSTFHCPSKNYYCFIDGFVDIPVIFWNNDSNIIFLATGSRWNAMTGEELSPYPIRGKFGRTNRDGSKLLTFFQISNKNIPDYINVYDTNSWSLTKVPLNGLHILNAIWTSEDKIIVGVEPTRENIGKIIDGYSIKSFKDIGYLLVDPLTGQLLRSHWFPSIQSNVAGVIESKYSNYPDFDSNNYETSQISLGSWQLLNDRTLEIRNYYSESEVAKFKSSPGTGPGTGGSTFSPDGKYLFLKDLGWFDNRTPITNVVIDTKQGRQVAEIGGELGFGHSGIALSPDGSMLALGCDSSVQILMVDNK